MTIRGLIEAVERGEFPGDVTARDLGMPDAQIAILTFYEAFSGSLDAAKALHDALLPGWFPGMSKNVHDETWFVWVQNKAGDHFTSFGATDDSPSRLWLLAILRALEGKP